MSVDLADKLQTIYSERLILMYTHVQQKYTYALQSRVQQCPTSSSTWRQLPIIQSWRAKKCTNCHPESDQCGSINSGILFPTGLGMSTGLSEAVTPKSGAVRHTCLSQPLWSLFTRFKTEEGKGGEEECVSAPYFLFHYVSLFVFESRK